ncbi:MAG: ABC-type lipopolysaccharide export system ATPase subunit [Planctomycetota bacterium]
MRARSSLSSEAHALYAIGDERASEATQGLLEKERELASIENSIDHLLEILYSDSPRKREKRTRATARELAKFRLDAIRSSLIAQLDDDESERIEIRAPRFTVNPEASTAVVRVELSQR